MLKLIGHCVGAIACSILLEAEMNEMLKAWQEWRKPKTFVTDSEGNVIKC